MPAAKEYRRKMLGLHRELGEVYPLASATTTTAVVTRLAVGTVTAQKYIGKWLVRAEAATAAAADRERLCSNYTASSGTLTHAGAVYTDTTATSEFLEILKYPVKQYDDAIDEALRKLRFTDRTEFPTVSGQSLYYLGELGWVDSANRVERVLYSTNPLVSRDRFIEKWATVSSAGVLQPDHWTLAGASGSVARSTTQNRRSRYSAAVVRSGTNVTLTQTLSLLINGTAVGNGEDLRGKTVRVVGLGWASSASQLRFRIADGTQTINTSFHTGGSAWEELSQTITIAATATSLSIAAVVEVDGTVYVDECYAVENDRWGDSVRRNNYTETEEPVTREAYRFGQVPGEVSVMLPARGRGGQYVFETSRPYPQFDSTRLLAGTADADVMDAPLVPVACMAIAELYAGMIGAEGQDDTRNRMLAGQWEAMAFKEAARHKATEPHPLGVEMPGRGMLGPRPMTARGL